MRRKLSRNSFFKAALLKICTKTKLLMLRLPFNPCFCTVRFVLSAVAKVVMCSL